MTQHTSNHIHKSRGFCKAEKAPEVRGAERTPTERGTAPSVPISVPNPPMPKQVILKPKITEDIVNKFITEKPRYSF